MRNNSSLLTGITSNSGSSGSSDEQVEQIGSNTVDKPTSGLQMVTCGADVDVEDDLDVDVMIDEGDLDNGGGDNVSNRNSET